MGAHAPVLLAPTSMNRIVAFYYKTIKYIANPNREYEFQQYMQGFSLGEPRGHTPFAKPVENVWSSVLFNCKVLEQFSKMYLLC